MDAAQHGTLINHLALDKRDAGARGLGVTYGIPLCRDQKKPGEWSRTVCSPTLRRYL